MVLAADGTEALLKAHGLKPDAITLDLLMPHGDGFEVLFDLQHSQETADIPVLIISAVDHKKVGIALGAAEYLIKPVDRETLLESITSHIHKAPLATTP